MQILRRCECFEHAQGIGAQRAIVDALCLSKGMVALHPDVGCKAQKLLTLVVLRHLHALFILFAQLELDVDVCLTGDAVVAVFDRLEDEHIRWKRCASWVIKVSP